MSSIGLEAYFPAVQFIHEFKLVFTNWPLVHDKHAVLPTFEYLPSSQVSHEVEEEVEVYVPEAHSVQEVGYGVEVKLEYWPAIQFIHEFS